MSGEIERMLLDARSEAQDIVANTFNKFHKRYVERDPIILDHIRRLYEEAVGTGSVDLSSGLTVGGSLSQTEVRSGPTLGTKEGS